jgi:hypothetical protein
MAILILRVTGTHIELVVARIPTGVDEASARPGIKPLAAFLFIIRNMDI